jgi:hypothetical protein
MTPMPRLENGQVTGKVFVMDYVGNMAEGEGLEPSTPLLFQRFSDTLEVK